MSRSVEGGARTAPVADQIFGERQPGLFKEARPADAFDPVSHALPRAGIFLVNVQYVFHRLVDLGPSWRIIGQAGSDHLHESRFAARVGVLAAHPDRQLGILRVIDLHRRTGWIARTAAHALGLIDFQGRFAIHHGRAYRRHRTTRHDRRTLAYVGDQIVIDHRRLGMLNDDRDVSLSAAVDFTA